MAGLVIALVMTASALDDRTDEIAIQMADEAGNVEQLAESVADMDGEVGAIGDSVTSLAGAVDQAVALASNQEQAVSKLAQANSAIQNMIQDQRWVTYVVSNARWSVPSWLVAPPGRTRAQGLLLTNESGDRAILVVDGLDPQPDGSLYRLWLKRDGDLVPAATFSVDETGYALVPLDLPFSAREYSGVGVMLEPLGTQVLEIAGQ